MEGTDTRGDATTAVLDRPGDAAQPAAQPAPGESGGQSAPVENENALMNGVFRARAGTGSTMTPGDDTAPDGQSAPNDGDEAPTGPERGADGRWIPRRGIPKAVQAAEDRAAEAERKLTEADPERLREQIRTEVLAEQARKTEESELEKLTRTRAADVARYRRLIEAPDADLSGEDYAWREEFKDKLKSAPEVEQLHREHARQTIEAERAAVSQREETFLDGMAAQMGRVGSRFGVETTSKGATFETIAEAIAAAVESKVRAEYRELEDENRQLKLTGPRGLATARPPLNSGASNGAPPPTDMNARFRAALGYGGD